MTRSDGTTYTVTASTGKLRRARQWLATGNRFMDYAKAMQDRTGAVAVLGDINGCGEDVDLASSSRDAVMPFELGLTDRTSGGFTAEPEICIDARKGENLLMSTDNVSLMYERNIAGEYSCSATEGAGVQPGSSLGGLASGSNATSPGWIILKDYYSPNKPSGDPARFEGVKLSFAVEDGGFDTVYDKEDGHFTVVRERDATAADGSTYTSRVEMNLLGSGRN
ncbi:hypothetical protein [Streptomyces sp. NPDC054887]